MSFTHKCSQCGAPVEIKPITNRGRCEYCGAVCVIKTTQANTPPRPPQPMQTPQQVQPEPPKTWFEQVLHHNQEMQKKQMEFWQDPQNRKKVTIISILFFVFFAITMMFSMLIPLLLK